MKTAVTPSLVRADGKARRKALNRSLQGEWHPELRKRTPQQLLDAASKGRLPALLPLKQSRMAVSPFSFYRGAASVMAYDLSLTANTGITTQLCGDAHIQNLGAYEGIDGKLIFDINDFDETIAGPFEWDVKRMATSILLAGPQAGLGGGACQISAAAFLDAYCALIRKFARLPVLEVARYQVRRLSAAAPLSEILGKAERATPLLLRKQLTKKLQTTRVFRSNPPVLRRVRGEEKQQVLRSLDLYRSSLLPERRHFLDQFEPIDVAFKVVGTGSVGLRAYCVYLEGNGTDDPLFLQVKQEVESVYAAYLPGSKPTRHHEGQRVSDGQRAMQLQSDPMLGWTRFEGHDYIVRQLNDHKAALDVTKLDAEGLTAYSSVCGEMLARGHARSGDARLIDGYIGRGKVFSRSILRFASAYAEQTTRDWKVWRRTIAT